MKVFHVISGLNDGGAEAVLYRLISHDQEDVHHVVSLTEEGKYGPLLRSLGATVTALGMPRGRLTWRGLRGLWKDLRTYKPDVVQTWMYHADLLGGVLGRLAGRPVVWGVHNTTLEPGRSSRATILVAHACGWLSNLIPEVIVACAERAVRAQINMGYKATRFEVIPNGCDFSRFVPDTGSRALLRAKWGMRQDIPLLGMVARFDPYKNHRSLIDALAHLHANGTDFAAVLVGTGVDEGNDELNAQIQMSGLKQHVRLLGPRADIPAVMNALDVHILSSNAEAFGNVLVEAMACGTPCVATDVGDATRIIGDTGWVVPPNDSRALADGIQAALQARLLQGKWEQRRLRTRQHVLEEYDIGVMVQRYRAVWIKAVKNRQERMS